MWGGWLSIDPNIQNRRMANLKHLLSPRVLRYFWAVVLIPVCAWSAYRYTELRGVESIREAAVHRADIYANTLTSELARYSDLPSVLSLNPDIVRLLQAPTDAALVARVNRYLSVLNRDAHSNTLYVMDTRGNTLAASNWDQPRSFVGENFAYRPYFRDALANGIGTFYGLGTTSKEAGYFYAERVYASGKVIGIATVKIRLDKLEQVWRRAADTTLVTDAHGVIFLSTYENWKYKSLHPLSPDVLALIGATHQYDAPGALQTVGLVKGAPAGAGAHIETFAPSADSGQIGRRFLASHFLLLDWPVPGTGWHIVTLSNIQPAQVVAVNAAVGVALGMALIMVLSLYLIQRRRIIKQALATRERLRLLNDELERKVTRRTEVLSRTNKALKVEVAERRHAEAVLKATLQELVQAGKMAALGQMSASITHELNQPLAALRTLSDNALVYMQRGDPAQAQENMRVICELTEKMGKITSQLKRFARKSPSYLEHVVVSSAISNALFLLDARMRRANVQLIRHESDGELLAIAEPNRLEQVLINLVGNALDAMEHVTQPVLVIAVALEDDQIAIHVRDNGIGLTPQAREHLFEPFFTTKDAGVGLGLGLTISFSIVREFGGTLCAVDAPESGAEFVIRLKQAIPQVNSHIEPCTTH